MGPFDRSFRQAFPRIERIAPIAAAMLVISAAVAASWWVFQPVPGENTAEAFSPSPAPLALPELNLPPTSLTETAAAPEPPRPADPVPQPAAPVAAPAPAPAAPTPQYATLQEGEITVGNPAPGPIAALPTAAAPSKSEPDRTADLRRFITGFDGGDCFLARPTELNADAALIEAFAASLPSVEALDQAFRRENGFEAQIGFRPVAPAQCPAINFVHGLSTSAERAPEVTIQSYNVGSGEPLSGAIQDDGIGALAVLLVGDDGSVHNLSDTLRRSGSTATFQVTLNRAGDGGAKPLLLVVIASPAPLAIFGSAELPAAGQTFPQLAEEAQRNGGSIAAALKYVKVEG